MGANSQELSTLAAPAELDVVGEDEGGGEGATGAVVGTGCGAAWASAGGSERTMVLGAGLRVAAWPRLPAAPNHGVSFKPTSRRLGLVDES